MHLRESSGSWSILFRRQDNTNPPPPKDDKDSGSTKEDIIFTVVILALAILILALYWYLRVLRIRGKSPKYLPTEYLKRKWDAWTPGPERYRASSALQDRRSIQMSRSRSPSMNPSTRVQRGGYGQISGSEVALNERSASAAGDRGAEDDSNVNRNTSVRSIMTLPAYTPAARETEEIIGREGDRAGIDTVVEFPETAEEEEARREEEMGELYQIREARRAAAVIRREERELRRAIREARSRGDDNAVRELRRLQNGSGENSRGASRNADQLIATHEANDIERERGRKISSVSYASLGVARHDGSRVRSHSASSDNQPLLTSAASMGGSRSESRQRSDSGSTQVAPTRTRVHNRAFSSSSSLARVYTPDMSDDERSSAEPEPPSYPRNSRNRSESRLTRDTSNESEQLTPPSDGATSEENRSDPPPPEYAENRESQYEDAVQHHTQRPGASTRPPRPLSDAPPYEDPQPNNGAPRLAPVAQLPSIQITPFSPVEENPNRSD